MKILIVDDSGFVRNVVRNLIVKEFQDIEVISAENGLVAYEKYLEVNPDMLITDLLMPEMQGNELISKIRDNDKSIKIIVISADIQKSTKDEIAMFGVIDYINKPIAGDSAERLLEVLRGEINA